MDTSTEPPPAPDPRRAMAGWYLLENTRYLWSAAVSFPLIVFVGLMVLRGEREDPKENFERSRAELLALQPPPVAKDENAAEDYKLAQQTHVAYNGPKNRKPGSYSINKEGPEYFELPSIKAYLDANAATLALLRSAAGKPRCNWGIDYATLPLAKGSLGHPNDELIALLLMSARQQAHRGDHAQAAEALAACYAYLKRPPEIYSEFYSEQAMCRSVDGCLAAIVMWDTPRTTRDVSLYRQALWRGRNDTAILLARLQAARALGLFELDGVASGRVPLPRFRGRATSMPAPGTVRVLLYPAQRRRFLAVADMATDSLRNGGLMPQLFEVEQKLGTQCPAELRSHVSILDYNPSEGEDRARAADAALAFLQFRIKHGRDATTLSELVPDYLERARSVTNLCAWWGTAKA